VRFAVAAALLSVVAVVAGVWLGRAQPDRAARIVVREFVVTEDTAAGAPGPLAEAPTSGSDRGDPVCGILDVPLDPVDQVRTVASGVVVLQHGPDATEGDREVLARVAQDRRVVVAPNPALPTAVVATAWRHRMPLERASAELLEAFVTGHGDRSPEARSCPGGDPGRG
jgi:hypothetical protein